MVSARFPFYCSQWLNCGGTREAGSGVSMLRRAMQPLQSMFDDNSPTQTNDGTPRSMTVSYTHLTLPTSDLV